MFAEVLYLSSIYAYDSLLMPSRFWAEGEGVGEAAWVPQRPPSSENYVLYSNMLRIWNWLFTPATYALVGGLGLLAYAVVHRLLNFRNGDLLFLGGVLVLAAVFCELKIQGEPHFGAQD